MKSFIVLWVMVLASASSPPTSDCDVCLRGNCFISAAIFDNIKEPKASKTVMYNNGNIMLYLDDGKLEAINLDTNTATPIPKLVPVIGEMGVDDVTGDLYYYTHNEYKVYKYQYKTNETSVINIPEPERKQQQLFKLWAHNGTLYFIWQTQGYWTAERGLNYLKGSTVQRISALEYITIDDIVFDALGNIYVGTERTVYKFKVNSDGTEDLKAIDVPIYTAADIELSSNKNGEIYVTDTSKSVIYQIDPVTDVSSQIGAYLKPKYVNLVMFDKNNNVIFRNYMLTAYFKVSSDKCSFNLTKEGWKMTLNITKL